MHPILQAPCAAPSGLVARVLQRLRDRRIAILSLPLPRPSCGTRARAPYDIVPPTGPSGYAPSDDSEYLGLEVTSVGTRHHFRHTEPDYVSEYWIDPATWYVTQVDGTSTRAGRTEYDMRVLDAFDSPAQIVAPSQCVTATPTPTAEP